MGEEFYFETPELEILNDGNLIKATKGRKATTDDKTEVQDIDYATAIGTVASYDVLDFTSNSATLAGTSGDVIEVIAVDDIAWCVLACLTTVHAEPASTAIINAS